MKVCREFDDVTSAGKLFHVRAAATGNAQSSTVDSRVGGTSNVEVTMITGVVDQACQESSGFLVDNACDALQPLKGVSQVDRA